MKKLFAEKIILSTSKNNFTWSGNNLFLQITILGNEMFFKRAFHNFAEQF